MTEQNRPVLGVPQTEERNVNLKALVFEYLIHWRLILICLMFVLGGAFVWLRYQTPIYNTTATVLIKQNDKKGGIATTALMAVQDMGMFTMANNFDNEIEILTSRTLVEKVVNTLQLNISYRESRRFGYATELYRNSPVQVYLASEEAERLPSDVRMQLYLLPDGIVEAKAVFHQTGEEYTLEQRFDSLPALFITPVGTFSLTADSSFTQMDRTRVLEVVISSPLVTARSCKARLSGAPLSQNTTIVTLNYKDTNPKRSVDFLNTLVRLYNEDANNDKNEVVTKTAEFIDERISIINRELSTTESELAAYKQQAGLTDLSSDAQLALQGNNAYRQKQADNETQLRLVKFLKDYINTSTNQYEVIPTNVGITDIGLSTQIDRYNQMLLERKRLLLTSSETNPVIVNLDASIEAMRISVLTSVNSVEKGLLISRSELEREGYKFQQRINDAPQQERELLSIGRQQEIKAKLYLLLLQKREENAIALAATANNGRVVETPLTDSVPISPKKQVILFVAFILGITLPVGYISLIRLLRYKIESRADIESITSVTLIGDIPLLPYKGDNAIVIQENRNGLSEEVFRDIRTNMQFLLQSGQQVILLTSTIPGEGKSFCTGNLAASLAFMGKRVVVVGLDIRKAGLNKVFHLSSKEEGITRFLAEPEHTDLLALCQKTKISPNLFVLPGGIIPPNPTELVARPALEQAIDLLRKHFDYVLLDTAPIGVVTDTQLIARVADMSVYVCRADYTSKNDYTLINDLNRDGKLPGLCTLLNGVDINKRRNGYYCGYSKYGYYGRYGKIYGYHSDYKNENE